MALDIYRLLRTASADTADAGDFDGNQQWGENLVTAVATSLAVLVVATIAVLIGMA